MTNHNWKNEAKIVGKKKKNTQNKSYTVGCCAFGSMINANTYIHRVRSNECVFALKSMQLCVLLPLLLWIKALYLAKSKVTLFIFLMNRNMKTKKSVSPFCCYVYPIQSRKLPFCLSVVFSLWIHKYIHVRVHVSVRAYIFIYRLAYCSSLSLFLSLSVKWAFHTISIFEVIS